MKAMILAAGRGERMRPLTDQTPKPLLTVGGKTLIEYHIEALRQAGIRELVINVAWLANQIIDYLGDGSRFNMHIQYSIETPALETAGGILNALPLLGEQPFMVVNSDIYTAYDFCTLLKKPQKLAHLILVENPEQHSHGDFSISNHLLCEKSQETFTFSGIALYQKAFFDGLFPGKKPLAPLLNKAMQQQQITAEVYRGKWFDIGTPERLNKLDRELSSQAT